VKDLERLKSRIRLIRDFPAKGVLFRDITPLLGNHRDFRNAIGLMHRKFRMINVDAVAAVESRGFIIGAPLAVRSNAAFVPIRKAGRLPSTKIEATYQLEYGKQSLEMHVDAIQPGQKVLIVDDVLATGGTSLAACELVERVGGKIIGLAFLIELSGLGGREKLKGRRIFSLIKDSRS